MNFTVLGSGSSGNATVIETAGGLVLIDAGFSARELGRRLDAVGLSAADISDVVLTHAHGDHVQGARAGARRWGWRLWATEATVARVEGLQRHPVTLFAPGTILDLPGARVETLVVPHDAPETLVVRVEDVRTGARVAIATDLGTVTPEVDQLLRGAGAVVLESNHDPEMLRVGRYPPRLKARVAGPEGHLSNAEAAATLARTGQREWSTVVLAHLSGENNDARLAREAAERACAVFGLRGALRVAWSDRPVGPFDVPCPGGPGPGGAIPPRDGLEAAADRRASVRLGGHRPELGEGPPALVAHPEDRVGRALEAASGPSEPRDARRATTPTPQPTPHRRVSGAAPDTAPSPWDGLWDEL